MHMLGTVLTRLVQKAGLLISTAMALIIKKLSELLGVLTVLKTQLVALCLSPLSPLVQTVLKIKAWRVGHIKVEQSTNQEPISAKQIATQLGLQPQTIARKTRQRVKAASKKGK